jgi:hypothetical protein
VDLTIIQDFGIGMEEARSPELQSLTRYLTNAPGKGRTVGHIVLNVEKEQGIQTASFQRVMLDPEELQSPQMEEFLAEQYEVMITALNLEQISRPILQGLEAEQDYMNGYVGAEDCRECHQEEYNQWKQTRHSIAFNTLYPDNRHWVPECVMCHVTGFGHDSGYKITQPKEELIHVQCETCHGPGQVHIDEFGTGPIRREVPKGLCVECHDQANSPDFEKLFDLYYRQIEH